MSDKLKVFSEAELDALERIDPGLTRSETLQAGYGTRLFNDRLRALLGHVIVGKDPKEFIAGLRAEEDSACSKIADAKQPQLRYEDGQLVAEAQDDLW